jgi:hypothetical protein
MGRKKKPEAEPRFARVEVTVTDGMEGFGSAFGSKPTGARATFTITDGYTTLERSYRLPSDAELSMEDQARVRDLFIVHRWQELINNLFPHLWDHPLIGGPEKGPFTDRNPWEKQPGKVVWVEPDDDFVQGAEPDIDVDVDNDLKDRIKVDLATKGVNFITEPVAKEFANILWGISVDGVNAEEDIRTSGEQERLECKVWDGSCIRSYRLQELLDRAGRY